MILFSRYKELERGKKVGGALFNCEWRIQQGGYLHLGQENWTFAHRVSMRGDLAKGKEEEFIVRAQMALDKEPRMSFITLELLNFFEARLLYFWLKIWPGRNLKIVFNLGWRLTLNSHRVLKNQVAEYERRNRQVMKETIKQNGGNKGATVI